MKFNNTGDRIKLTLEKCPQNLVFIHILFYKKKTKNDISDAFREKFHIPSNITNYKAQIFHENHSFKLINLIESVQKNNSIICPICHQGNVYMYYQSSDPIEQAMEFICNDKETSLIELLPSFSNDHIFNCKYKFTKLFQDGPTLISLCAFFGSKKCFQSLINHYKAIDHLPKINQKDYFNRSPIHFACFGGDLSIIQTLIEFHESFDCTDCNGLRPIHYAEQGGNLNVIKYLHEKKLIYFHVTIKKGKIHFILPLN